MNWSDLQRASSTLASRWVERVPPPHFWRKVKSHSKTPQNKEFGLYFLMNIFLRGITPDLPLKLNWATTPSSTPPPIHNFSVTTNKPNQSSRMPWKVGLHWSPGLLVHGKRGILCKFGPKSGGGDAGLEIRKFSNRSILKLLTCPKGILAGPAQI